MHETRPLPEDEFLDRLFRGDAPALDEFLAEHPELSGDAELRLRKLVNVFVTPVPKSTGVPFETLADYRLIARLGEGGMGTVYLAEQRSLGREIALKLLRPEVAAHPESRARFEREARAVAKLRHDHIVDVIEAGSDRGVSYLAMELVPGEGLDEILAAARRRERKLAVRDFVIIARDIARALECAHAAGILHRDVKPSNIRVTPDGRAKLLDFGLAFDPDSASISRSGQFHGTLHYASPEQIGGSGRELDGRTDVWSLGVTLYECVTGRVPFDGETSQSILLQIATREPVAPRKLAPDLSRDLETVILKALEKERERRYASAAEFADDLGAILELRPIRARPTGAMTRAWKWSRREPAFATAIGLGVLLFVGGPSVYAWMQKQHGVVLAKEQRSTSEALSRAIASEKLTQRRALELEDVVGFQAKMLSSLDVATLGRRLTEDLRKEVERSITERQLSPARQKELLDSLDTAMRGTNAANVAVAIIDRNILQPSLQTIDTRFAEQPVVQAKLIGTILEAYHGLGATDRLGTYYERVELLCRAQFGSEDLRTLDAIAARCKWLTGHGERREVQMRLEELLTTLERVHPGERGRIAETLGDLGALAAQEKDWATAETHLTRALELYEAATGRDSMESNATLARLGAMNHSRGQEALAKQQLADAMRGLERANARDTTSYLGASNLLVQCLQTTGDITGALREIENGLATARAIHGDESQSVAALRGSLAQLQLDVGRTDASEASSREAIRIVERLQGDDVADLAPLRMILAQALSFQNRITESLSEYERALAIAKRTRGEHDTLTLGIQEGIASTLLRTNRAPEGLAMLRSLVDVRLAIELPGSYAVTRVLASYGKACDVAGKKADAEAAYRLAIDELACAPQPAPSSEVQMRQRLGSLLMGVGRDEEAADVLATSRALCAADPSWFGRIGISAVSDEARALYFLKRYAESASVARDAHRVGVHVLGADNTITLRAQLDVARALAKAGEKANALPEIDELEARVELLPANQAAFVNRARQEIAESLTWLAEFPRAEQILVSLTTRDAHGVENTVLTNPFIVRALVQLYVVWERAEPGQHGARIEQWKRELARVPSGS